MEYKVEASNKKVQKYLESLMPKFINELGLTNSRRAVLVKVTGDTQDGMEGSTEYLQWADCYLVLIRPPARQTLASTIQLSTTLAHEMVHVRQMAKGILKVTNKGTFWRGKKYTKSTPYLHLPWELDAFSRQEIVFRRAIEI
jgi:7-keto-8-aminopelargonate synthetase-like enzyme